MGRKYGLTLERHREIGGELKEMFNKLIDLTVEVGNAYPVTGDRGRPYIRLSKAHKEISIARSILEDLLYAEHPEDATIDFYYNGKEKI